jgi:hypothetical protein
MEYFPTQLLRLLTLIGWSGEREYPEYSSELTTTSTMTMARCGTAFQDLKG